MGGGWLGGTGDVQWGVGGWGFAWGGKHCCTCPFNGIPPHTGVHDVWDTLYPRAAKLCEWPKQANGDLSIVQCVRMIYQSDCPGLCLCIMMKTVRIHMFVVRA